MALHVVDDLELLPDLYRTLPKDEEFAACVGYRPEDVARVARHGYLPMTMGDLLPAYVLLIKCHVTRSVLAFDDLHISRSTQRHTRRYQLTIDTDFDRVLAAIDAHHADNWIVPELAACFRALHRRPVGGVSFHSVELRDTGGGLVAGEIGYAVGRVYTSVTGFHAVSGAGTVQLVLLAHVLQRAGAAFWDLGMESDYKARLGAHGVPRADFVPQYREHAAAESIGRTLATTAAGYPGIVK